MQRCRLDGNLRLIKYFAKSYITCILADAPSEFGRKVSCFEGEKINRDCCRLV